MYRRPRLIPSLLLHNGGLVKTIKFQNGNYLGDPINAVKIFNEKGVDELCLLDIDASKEGSGPDFELLTEIASEAFMPLSYGGGITNMEEIHKLFYIGFEKVIINTAFVQNPQLVTEAAAKFGSQSIVVGIDVKKNLLQKYDCYIKDGTEKVKKSPEELAMKAENVGAGELFLNSIDRDGTMNGYDLNLVEQVAQAVSIPVIACGGAASIRDFSSVLGAGAHAAAAGSMFVYFGKKKAVLIHAPSEQECIDEGIYEDE